MNPGHNLGSISTTFIFTAVPLINSTSNTTKALFYIQVEISISLQQFALATPANLPSSFIKSVKANNGETSSTALKGPPLMQQKL